MQSFWLPDDAQGLWRGGHCCMQQPLRQCRQIMAAVEAIGKLSQVACAVLVVLDPVIRRIQGHFHVAQHDVDTAQRRVLRRLAPTAGDVALMAGAHRADLSKAARAIGDHVGIRGQRRIGPTPDDLAGKAGQGGADYRDSGTETTEDHSPVGRVAATRRVASFTSSAAANR